MKSFLRGLGAIDDEDEITPRGRELLQSGLTPFLQRYVPGVKIVSPQAKKFSTFKKGHRQASYGSYRIRMFLMIMYAASIAQRNKVTCTIDDVALTACRFWPISESDDIITEAMVRSRIDSHFSSKLRGSLNMEMLFRRELELAMNDSECRRMSKSEINRKFRNAADNVNNYFRLLKQIGLLDVSPHNLNDDTWSLCKYADGKTGRVAPCQIRLTARGDECLTERLAATPIWLLDVILHFGLKQSHLIDQAVTLIDQLARNKSSHLPEEKKLVALLKGLEVEFRSDNNTILLTKSIDFDWCYDMHKTGKKVKSLFES
jgi:hypothetical protein